MTGQTHEKGRAIVKRIFLKLMMIRLTPLYIIKKPNFKNKSFFYPIS